ncbi:MAG: SDR family oxidoreductase [Galbitalea sp.]
MIDYRGSTVVITGASSGLGAEFAAQLAARGANLILVARRADRLEALGGDLEARHGVTVTPLPADLTAPGAASALAERVKKLGLPVHSLINNAGFGTHNLFQDEDADRIAQEVTLNVSAVVDLTKAFYPELLQHGSGVLVNVASTAAFQPIPRMAIYGASKAFVLSFTEALWYEARPSGLRVLALCPGATTTEFFDVAGPEGPHRRPADLAAGGSRGAARAGSAQPAAEHRERSRQRRADGRRAAHPPARARVDGRAADEAPLMRPR